MSPILTDPSFYAVAIPAVLLVGLAKGGFGGSMALLGVPLMALVISPVQAAAIMLPILVLMDIVSLWTWRGISDGRLLLRVLPGALAGVAVGWLTAAVVTADMVRLIVGVFALVFFARWMSQALMERRNANSPSGPSPHNAFAGTFWGLLSGFTSFVAHAGGPPYQIYAMPLRQSPALYTGTSVVFFSIVNAVKLIPYFALGQFDTVNLAASLVLMPLAPLATLAGAWLVRRMKPQLFYPFMYAMVLLVGIKLVWDGSSGLLSP